MMTNFTPRQWFECDLAVVTKAGYFVEYEVKLTVADIRADAKKYRERYLNLDARRTRWPFRRCREFKHDQMRQSDVRGPSRYFMAVPESLVDRPEIPKWAGVVKLSDFGSRRLHASLYRPAQRLHGHKVDRQFVQLMQRSGYYRYWSQVTGTPAEEQVA